MMQTQLKTDLSLKYLESEPSPTQGAAPLAIFIHGRGANEEDLFDLAPNLGGRFRVLAVRAPIDMGPNAYGWFHSQYPKDLPAIDNLEEVETSRQLLLQFIKKAQAKYDVKPSQTFLFGFSQGAMLSQGILLTSPEHIGGIAALSGRVIPHHLPTPNDAEKFRNLPVFISHGIEDDLLPIHYGRASRDTFAKLPVKLEYHEYPMGHDVTDMNFKDVEKWFEQRLTSLKSK